MFDSEHSKAYLSITPNARPCMYKKCPTVRVVRVLQVQPQHDVGAHHHHQEVVAHVQMGDDVWRPAHTQCHHN